MGKKSKQIGWYWMSKWYYIISHKGVGYGYEGIFSQDDTAGSLHSMGYGTITTEKSCGKRPSGSAYAFVRIGTTPSSAR